MKRGQLWKAALRRARVAILCAALVAAAIQAAAQTQASAPEPDDYLFNDIHFHLTNYIQEGVKIRDFLKTMGNKAGRVALFGIPLQQQWSFRVDGERRPDLLLELRRPALLLLVHGRLDCRSLQIAFQRRAGPFRSDDNGLQPFGHVRRGPCAPRAPSLPRRLLRHRGVQYSQRVRLG